MQHQLVLALQLSDLFFKQRPVMRKLIAIRKHPVVIAVVDQPLFLHPPVKFFCQSRNVSLRHHMRINIRNRETHLAQPLQLILVFGNNLIQIRLCRCQLQHVLVKNAPVIDQTFHFLLRRYRSPYDPIPFCVNHTVHTKRDILTGCKHFRCLLQIWCTCHHGYIFYNSFFRHFINRLVRRMAGPKIICSCN